MECVLGWRECVTGDVNGDFALNLGDPIYLLTHLFQGGPEPLACADGPQDVVVTNTVEVRVATPVRGRSRW